MMIREIKKTVIISQVNQYPQLSGVSKGEKGEEFAKALQTAQNDSDYDHLFCKTEEELRLPCGILKAVAQVESNFNPNVVSRAGAQGIMQLMPATAKSLGVCDPFNPAENIAGAGKYLGSLLDRYQGDVKLALAAYNAGPGNVAKYQGVPPFKETEEYLGKIFGILGTKNLASEIKPDVVHLAMPVQDFVQKEKTDNLAYLKYVSQLNFLQEALAEDEKDIF